MLYRCTDIDTAPAITIKNFKVIDGSFNEKGYRLLAIFNITANGFQITGCTLSEKIDGTARVNGPRGRTHLGFPIMARILDHGLANETMTEKTEEKGEGGLAALEAKVAELDKKADTSAVVARLDKLEAKMNRPAGETKAEATEDRKAFGTYLRMGNAAPAEEMKALTVSSDPQGGYLAPAEMSAEFIRDLVEVSPVRSVASVRTTVSPSVIYPTRTGITNAKWKGETQAAEASEPGFGQAEVTVHELTTFTDISNQLLADASQAEAEVRLALTEDFGQKEGLAYVSGSGVGQPEGIMTHAGIADTASGHATQVTADALVALVYAQPATYRNAGTWAMNGTTLGILRLLKDGDGRFLWQPSYQAGQPETTPRSEVFVPSQNGAILNVQQAQAALRGQSGGAQAMKVDVAVSASEDFNVRVRKEATAISQAHVAQANRLMPDRNVQIAKDPRRRG